MRFSPKFITRSKGPEYLLEELLRLPEGRGKDQDQGLGDEQRVPQSQDRRGLRLPRLPGGIKDDVLEPRLHEVRLPWVGRVTDSIGKELRRVQSPAKETQDPSICFKASATAHLASG